MAYTKLSRVLALRESASNHSVSEAKEIDNKGMGEYDNSYFSPRLRTTGPIQEPGLPVDLVFTIP